MVRSVDRILQSFERRRTAIQSASDFANMAPSEERARVSGSVPVSITNHYSSMDSISKFKIIDI